MILDSLVSQINWLGINYLNGGFVCKGSTQGDTGYIHAERRSHEDYAPGVVHPILCL
ncbi:MAG: hypothetical protein P8N51_06130 [Pseudomonadales bacterium]|nr:hypothetical protein [Pseudomonadales bacterium]